MRSSFSGLPLGLRVSVVGFITGAAILAPVWAPASAQPGKPGAKQSVTITDEDKSKATPGAPAATPGAPAGAATPGAAPPPPTHPAPKQTGGVRDPFIAGVVKDDKASAPAPVVKVEAVKKAAEDKGAKAAKADKKAADEVAPPAVTISGILLSGSGNRAILTSPTQSYVVKAGDKLGDYKVASIEKKAVNFKFQDKTFKIEIEPDMAAAAPASTKAPKKGK